MIDPEDLARLAASVQAWGPSANREIALSVPVQSGLLSPLVLIALGDVQSVRVQPPEVFRPATRAAADGVVLVHTHLDDSPPTSADLAVTRRLVAAGAVVGIPLVAHLVIGPAKWADCLEEARRARAA